MIVLDASAVVELVLGSPRGASVRARIQRPDESLHAPHLLDVEVASVLRRYQLSGELSAEDGREALADLAGLDIARYPHDPLLPRVWELRTSVTAYDAPSTWHWRRFWRRPCSRWTGGWPAPGATEPVLRCRDAPPRHRAGMVER